MVVEVVLGLVRTVAMAPIAPVESHGGLWIQPAASTPARTVMRVTENDSTVGNRARGSGRTYDVLLPWQRWNSN